MLPRAQNIQQFSPIHPLRHDPKAKPDISGVGDPPHPRDLSPRSGRLGSGGWLAGIACRGSDYAKLRSLGACADALLSNAGGLPRPKIRLTSMRVGFLRTLNEYDARVLLNPREDDFGAVW